MLLPYISMFLEEAPPLLPAPLTGTPSAIAASAISFFSLWLARIGGIIAFAGTLKFALSIKSDDAKEQMLFWINCIPYTTLFTSAALGS